MVKFREYETALKLRSEGKSYSQIKNELKVAKSTLSLWLRKYPLSKDQIRLLRDVSETRIEKFRQTMQRKKEIRLEGYYSEEAKNWLPLSKRELGLAGLFLYWGEGSKYDNATLCIANTNPQIILFSLFWMTIGLMVPKSKIKVRLHLYSDMNVNQETDYWANLLSLPKSQFSKPYIKKTTRAGLDRKGFGHGTCNLQVFSKVLKDRVLMSIKAIAERYSPEDINSELV